MGSNAEFQNRSTLRLRLYIACLKRSSPDTPSLETPEWACELLENLSFPSLCSKSKVLSQQVIPSEKAVVKGFEEGMGFFHWDLPRFFSRCKTKVLVFPRQRYHMQHLFSFSRLSQCASSGLSLSLPLPLFLPLCPSFFLSCDWLVSLSPVAFTQWCFSCSSGKQVSIFCFLLFPRFKMLMN